jgi:hypothetical protein
MNWTYNTGLNGVVQIVLCECDVHPTASVYYHICSITFHYMTLVELLYIQKPLGVHHIHTKLFVLPHSNLYYKSSSCLRCCRFILSTTCTQ